MVQHLVMWKFKEDKLDQLDEAVRLLKSMVGKVEVIRELKAGRDFLRLARSFDLGLAVTFDDRHALEVYDQHPDHQPIKRFMATVVERSVSVDFEE